MQLRTSTELLSWTVSSRIGLGWISWHWSPFQLGGDCVHWQEAGTSNRIFAYISWYIARFTFTKILRVAFSDGLCRVSTFEEHSLTPVHVGLCSELMDCDVAHRPTDLVAKKLAVGVVVSDRQDIVFGFAWRDSQHIECSSSELEWT